mgnify:CR=1
VIACESASVVDIGFSHQTIGLAENGGTLDAVFQLAHVALPRGAANLLGRREIEPQGSVGGLVLTQKQFRQWHDVSTALSKG